MMFPIAYMCNTDVLVQDLILPNHREQLLYSRFKFDSSYRVQRGEIIFISNEEYMKMISDSIIEGWLFSDRKCEKVQVSSQLLRIYFSK